jgi:ABC-type uncharacterized transport system permease subunit
MHELDFAILMASIVAGAAPVILATIGETITEKAGLINLSLDGSILLSAMTAFAVASNTGSLTAGFAAAALVGALTAGIVAIFSIYLRQSQVAVGFILTLMTRDLAYFIGNPYARLHGPQVLPQPILFLKSIPFVGTVFFNHNWTVYFSLVLIAACWWYFYRTSLGLKLRAVGENPQAAFARGIDPQKVQLLYAICGGILVGMAGAAFSLCAKPGWGRPQGAEGTGWIALALVIFGGWHPVRAAMGAYLFSFLQVMGIYFQGWLPSVPAQVFQVAPFPLMIFALILMFLAQKDSMRLWAADKPRIQPLLALFDAAAPRALGKPPLSD